MGEQGIKRLISVFAEAMSRVASRQSRVSQAIGDDTKADGDMLAQICNTQFIKSHLHLDLLTLTHSTYAHIDVQSLKARVYHALTPFTTSSVVNGLFLMLQTKHFSCNRVKCVL